MFRKNDKRIMNGWAFYDWANSVYNLVITSAVFPTFYKDTLLRANPDGMVMFFSMRINVDVLYSYIMSASAAILVFILPLLSGVADYKGTKKRYLKFFCYLGSAACIALYWFNPEQLEWSMLPVFLASVGFWSSLVFYNSYLPDIATTDQHDRLSAKGFSLGYIGSVILLTAILVGFIRFDMNIRYGFLAVGIWWAGFAQVTYNRLPKDVYGRHKKVDMEKPQVTKGFRELIRVFRELQDQITLKRYLAAYFVYNMGVQTVMIMAVIFAKEEIRWPLKDNGDQESNGLIISILLIQLVAIVGATIMSRLTRVIGNINVIRSTIVVWAGVCVIAYNIHTPTEFYVLAVIVGFVMGGIQAISRSTYAKMLPDTIDTTSYFSFYDTLEKIGLAVGTFIFGSSTLFSGNMRFAVLVLMGLFIVGFLLLFWAKPNFRTKDTVVVRTTS